MANTATQVLPQKGEVVNGIPNVEYLHECFTFNEATGELIWKARPVHHFARPKDMSRFNTIHVGSAAGCKTSHPDGRRKGMYIGMRLASGKQFTIMVHICIVRMAGIEIPEGYEVDHKDRDPWNNRMENLRVGTCAQNCFNRKARADKKEDLPKGVFRKGKKFGASISVQGRRTYLGVFLTPDAAEQAYLKAAQQHQGEFAIHLSQTA